MTADPRHFRTALARWGSTHRRSFPWRETENPFRVLVAEVLLQRSRGKTVVAVFEQLFERWPSADELSRARVDSIATVIRPLGLLRRAATLKSLAQAVSELGSVPRTLEGLLELPGVGPYAANATLAVVFGRHVPVVDGVTARVYRRYFGLEAKVPPSTDRSLWNLVEDVTPRHTVREWNWSVLDLAASICLPKVPKCNQCPLQEHCAWSQDSRDRVTASC
jgi:A/G-specific adenine glycosylase